MPEKRYMNEWRYKPNFKKKCRGSIVPHCHGAPRWRPTNGRSGIFICDRCWEQLRPWYRKAPDNSLRDND